MAALNLALYYPSMEFRNVDWLKGMVLFWDGILRIVPKSYSPKDEYDVEAFVDAGIIRSIDPGKDAADIADDFKNKLENQYKGAAALDCIERPGKYDRPYRIHPAKVDARLREVLSAKDISSATRDWLQVSAEFGRYYMLYLANAMAEKRGLVKITDSKEAWTVSSYFDYDGGIDGFPKLDSNRNILTLMLRGFIPDNIEDIPPNSIISFREKYRDERKRFIGSVKNFVTQLSSIDDPQIVEDVINEHKLDVEKSVKDLKGSLRSLKFKSLVGIKTVSFPVGFNVVSILGTGSFEYTTISSIAGLALGLLTSYVDYRGQRKKTVKECDFSYVYFLANNFDNWHYDGGPLNYHLYRNIEEFIND